MRRIIAASLLLATSVALSGCTLFYPNWGATTAPVETPSETSTPTSEPSPTQTTPPKPKQPVSVEIMQADTDAAAGTITVIAQATGISEDGGNCTLIVTQASSSKSVTAKAESNVTDTQCFPLSLSIVGLSPGDASFTVSYDSSSYTGKSTPQAITIP